MATLEESAKSTQSPAEDGGFPGPRGHWFSGCIRPMKHSPLDFYTNTWKQYGDYVRVCVVPSVFCYVLTHPDAVEHVLLKKHKNFRKPDIFYKSMGLLVGDGLFTNEGEGWIKQRRLAQPAFHSSYLSLLTPLMVQGAEAFVREHESKLGQPIDIVDAMMRVGLRIASTTLFSTDISAEADRIGRAFRTAFAHVSHRLNSLQIVPNWLPTPRNLIFAHSKRLLDNAVLGIISARKKAVSKPYDLLTMLLAAHDELTGEAMPSKLLMDEVLTLLTAGHETIGAALSWSWYLLAKHPEVQESLYEEVHARLRGASPNVDDLPHLPLAKAVFEEALRLFPPGWGELRETIEPDEIDGFTVPAKSLVLLCQWVTHRHPDFWSEPDQFRPERFLAGSACTGSERHRFAYFPFGGGPRICIGTQFALMEGPLVLATILQSFRVTLASEVDAIPDATFALRPKGGLKVVLKRR